MSFMFPFLDLHLQICPTFLSSFVLLLFKILLQLGSLLYDSLKWNPDFVSRYISLP